jgi:hypothetical protein
MRPTVSDQLAGLARALDDVVAPEVDDAYAVDVLDGVVGTLEMLAEKWTDVAPYLRWDVDATGKVLALVGVGAPPVPDDPLDVAALEARHHEVQELLVRAMPAVVDDPDARDAVVRLFRDRAERYPLAARPRGGFGAHAAR